MPITLHAMRAADLPAIQALWVAAWQARLPEIDFAARRDWLATHLAGLHAAGATTLCAVEGAAVEAGATGHGAIAGFLTWLPADGLIEQLAAHPARFGAGIGYALLAAVKQQRPAGLHLLVNQQNPRAVAFYRREGFVIAGATTNPGGTRPLWRMRWPGRPVFC